MSLLLDTLTLAIAWAHVLLTPYTKVEESFNLHATHDVLMYGISSNSLKNVCLCDSPHCSLTLSAECYSHLCPSVFSN